MNGEGPRLADWRKASFSNQTDSCVEVHRTRLFVRDTKNPNGPILEANLSGLLAAIRHGHLDR